MSRLKECKLSALSGESKSSVLMARRARCDATFGGAKALVYAERLESMGSFIDYHAIIGACYASSTGASDEYMGYECPECGSAHVSAESAYQCCAFDECEPDYGDDE